MSNSFTTQWENQNIKIIYPTNLLLNFFIRIFFKRWEASSPKECSNQIIVKLKKDKNETIKTQIFNYSREVVDSKVITSIYNVKILRAFVRSLFKSVVLKQVLLEYRSYIWQL